MTNTNAPAEPVPDILQDRSALRQASKHFQGVTERDIALVERISLELASLGRFLRKGDVEGIRKLNPILPKLLREAERVRAIARRAISRNE